MFKGTPQEYDVSYEVIEFDNRPLEDWVIEYVNGEKRVRNYKSQDINNDKRLDI